MRRFGLPFLLLISAAALTLACGSSSSSLMTNHQLRSIGINPATADAKDYANGQVPFVATGAYSSAPAVVAPLQANWAAAVSLNGAATSDVTINSNGVAQCASGASGTYSIGAWALILANSPAVCGNVIGPYGEPGCGAVLGTAQLTCP